MPKTVLSPLHPVAKLLRGWPSSPNTYPRIPLQINRYHPLAPDFFIDLRRMEVYGGKGVTVELDGAGFTRVPDGVHSTGVSGASIKVNGLPAFGLSAWSVATSSTWEYVDGSAFPAFWGRGDTGAGQMMVRSTHASSGLFGAYGFSGILNQSAGSVKTGNRYFTGLTCEGGVGGDAFGYLDGAHLLTDVNGTFDNTETEFTIGNADPSGSTNRMMGGTFEYAAIWLRYLSAEEWARLALDEYQYLEPKDQSPVILGAAAAASTANYAIPAWHPIAKRLKGWPSAPNVKPKPPLSVNWNSPYAEGLINCFTLGHSAPTDLASSTSLNTDSSSIGVLNGGEAREYSASGSNYTNFDGDEKLLALPATIVCQFQLNSAPASNTPIFRTHDHASASRYFQGLGLVVNSSRELIVTAGLIGTSSSHRKYFETSFAFTLGQVYTIAVTVHSVSSATIFIDGQEISYSTSGTAGSVAFPLGAAYRKAIATWQTNLLRYLDCTVSQVLLYNVGKADAELRDLSLDCYLPMSVGEAPILIGAQAAAATTQYPIPAYHPIAKKLKGWPTAPNVKRNISAKLSEFAKRRRLEWFWDGQSKTGVWQRGNYGHAADVDSGSTFSATAYGKARKLTADADHFYFTDDTLAHPVNRQKLTFFVDVVYNGSGSSSSGFVFANTQAEAAGYNWGIYRHHGTGSFHAYVKTGGSATSTPTGNSNASVVVGKRYRVAVVYDGSTITQYINGKEAGSVAKTGDVDISAFDICFDRWNTASRAKWDYLSAGVFHDALSSSEAVELTNDLYSLVFEPADQSPIYMGQAEVVGGDVTGTLSAQESGADTAAITGTAPALITGSLAAQEAGSDASTILGSVHVSGTLSVQETGADGATITGDVLVAGTLSVQESDSDTATISGSAPAIITGTLAVQEVGSDTAAMSGAVIPIGSGYLSAQESGSDTLAGTGAVQVAGDLAAQETGADTATISGSAPALITGTLDVTEAGSDTGTILGQVQITGTLAAQESGSDTASMYQSQLFTGDLAVQETGADSASIGGLIAMVFDLAGQETVDACYSVHAIPAVYTVSGVSIIVQTIRDIDSQFTPGAMEIPVRSDATRFRVRSSEVTKPDNGARLHFKGSEYRVDGYERVSQLEWLIYGIT